MRLTGQAATHHFVHYEEMKFISSSGRTWSNWTPKAFCLICSSCIYFLENEVLTADGQDVRKMQESRQENEANTMAPPCLRPFFLSPSQLAPLQDAQPCCPLGSLL